MLYLGPYPLSQRRNKKLKIMFSHLIFSEAIFNSRNGKALLYHKGLSPRAEEDTALCPEAVRECRGFLQEEEEAGASLRSWLFSVPGEGREPDRKEG